MNTESFIDFSRNILLILFPDEEAKSMIENLASNFCGQVCYDMEKLVVNENNIVYVCGDVTYIDDLYKITTIYAIHEFSFNIPEHLNKVPLGKVPIHVHKLGVYWRQLIDDKNDYFHILRNSHNFQELTESNKPSKALRKGVYLTPVTEDFQFQLLRCSSNLTGPSENLTSIDKSLISRVNFVCNQVFTNPGTLNHILAQVYENKKNENKERKAVIKAHSDKTKDMPSNGLIVFTTFYDNIVYGVKHTSDPFNLFYGTKLTSVLTRLYFKSKETNHEFSITLYPNSVFVIPLSTNRLYTHEIRASILPIDYIPTRLSYVMRCSSTKAIHTNGQTYIIKDNDKIPLISGSNEEINKLKQLYLLENTTTDVIDYPPTYFSLNGGDYLQPLL